MALMETKARSIIAPIETTRCFSARNKCHETIEISRDVSRNDRPLFVTPPREFGRFAGEAM
jgi:hypothetical protein